MKNEEKAFILLLKSYCTHEPQQVYLDAEEWQLLLRLAKHHGVEGLLCAALDGCDTNIPQDLKKEFLQMFAKTACVFHMQRAEYANVSAALGEAGVRNIRMKGILLSDLYPTPEQRTSCDIDILYDRADTEKMKETLERLGYRIKGQTVKDITFFKAPVISIEMHHSLFDGVTYSSMQEFDPWTNASENGQYPLQYEMSKEDNYIFTVFHLVKHIYFSDCITVRPFLDIEFFLQAYQDQLDWAYIDEKLKKNELDRIEQAIRHLIRTWFYDAPRNETDDSLELFLFCPDAQKKLHSKNLLSAAEKKRGRILRYYSRRLFAPKEEIWERYPNAKKHKILTPFYGVVRLFAFFRPGNRERFQSEIEVANTITSDEMNAAKTVSDLIAKNQ